MFSSLRTTSGCGCIRCRSIVSGSFVSPLDLEDNEEFEGPSEAGAGEGEEGEGKVADDESRAGAESGEFLLELFPISVNRFVDSNKKASSRRALQRAGDDDIAAIV